MTCVYGANTFLAIRRWRLGNSCQGATHSSEYIRARTASRGEMEARPELVWVPATNQSGRLREAGATGSYGLVTSTASGCPARKHLCASRQMGLATVASAQAGLKRLRSKDLDLSGNKDISIYFLVWRTIRLYYFILLFFFFRERVLYFTVKDDIEWKVNFCVAYFTPLTSDLWSRDPPEKKQCAVNGTKVWDIVSTSAWTSLAGWF